MKVVAGVFDTNASANQALVDLLNNGFSKDDVSVLVTDEGHSRLFGNAEEEANRAARGGLAGAAFGGALGALIAGLTTVGLIVIPGANLLAVGPLVAALSGGGAGAAIGGLSGALISAGFAADEARRYEEEIKRGNAVVVVHARDGQEAAKAHMLLLQSGAMIKAA